MSSLIKLVSDTVPLYSRLAIFVGLAALAAVKLAPLMDEKHSVQSRITKKELAEPMDSALFPQYIRNPEGLYLFIRRWEVPNAVAHVFFAHGFAEHCSRYDHLARLFNARGISVHAMDHQGHGLSDGDRAHVERFQHFVRDFALFVQTEQHRIAANDGFPAAGDISASVPGYTRPPCFLLGHSMGGLICTHIALAQEQSYASLPPHWPWAGLMLSSPALALDPSLQNPAIIAAGKVVSYLLPKLPMQALDTAVLSHLPAVNRRYARDSGGYQGLARARFGIEFLVAIQEIQARMGCLHLPIYTQHSELDRICIPEGSRMLHSRAPSTDSTLEIVPGVFHEHMHEVQWAQSIDKYVDWVLRHLTPRR